MEKEMGKEFSEISDESSNDPDYSIKRKIIPDHWKDNIDAKIKEELVGANRYFAETTPLLAQSIELQKKEKPDVFNRELKERWSWHNNYYEDFLERAIPNLLEDDAISLSPRQVQIIKDSYETSDLVDQATLIVSASIKKHLEYWMDNPLLNLDEDDKTKLITPAFDTFWVEYKKDHLQYLLRLRGGDDSLKEELVNKYHIGDPIIFKTRLLRDFGEFQNLSVEELQMQLDQLSISELNQTESIYLTLEHPQLKALVDTLHFDNYEEYLIIEKLIGFSGFLLRKKVLHYLDETKIQPNDERIYSLKVNDVLSGLEKLRAYRKDLLRKPIVNYRQTGDTCSSVTTMMALHNFDHSFCVDGDSEDAIHKMAKSKLIPGDHYSALANFLASKGLEVKLIHEESEMFSNSEKLFSDEMFLNLMEEYKRWLPECINNGVEIINGQRIDADLFHSLLEDDYLVISAGSLGTILHSILLHGYNQQGFIVADPLRPKSQVWDREYIEKFTNTKIGKWMIAVRRTQEVVGNLSEKNTLVRKQALQYLAKT